MIHEVDVPETEGRAIDRMLTDEHFRWVLNAKCETIKMGKFTYLRRRLGKNIKIDTNDIEKLR